MSAEGAVMVTDGEQRAALAAVRSLAAAGRRVIVASARKDAISRFSRGASDFVLTPAPLSSPREFVDVIREVAARHQITSVFPAAEPATLAVIEFASGLGNYTLPFQDADAFVSLCDKAKVLDVADELGMATPARISIASPSDVRDDIPGRSFPMVVKSVRSVSGPAGSRGKFDICYVADMGELRQAVNALPPSAFPLMAQQRIIGHGVGVSMLVWNGTLKAVFCHRRLREKPPSGGVCVYGEGIPPEANLVNASLRLLSRFGWGGAAMVEYKVDQRDGTPYLMEVNPRFWGSMQLAIDSGVDFPALLLLLMEGEEVRPIVSYTAGRRLRWFWGDVDHLIAQLRRPHRPDGVELSNASIRSHAMKNFLRLRSSDGFETFRFRDPMPFVIESLNWFRRAG